MLAIRRRPYFSAHSLPTMPGRGANQCHHRCKSPPRQLTANSRHVWLRRRSKMRRSRRAARIAPNCAPCSKAYKPATSGCAGQVENPAMPYPVAPSCASGAPMAARSAQYAMANQRQHARHPERHLPAAPLRQPTRHDIGSAGAQPENCLCTRRWSDCGCRPPDRPRAFRPGM